MKESKYGRRGSAVPVHDLRIQQLEAEVEKLRGMLLYISIRSKDPMFETAEVARRAVEGE